MKNTCFLPDMILLNIEVPLETFGALMGSATITAKAANSVVKTTVEVTVGGETVPAGLFLNLAIGVYYNDQAQS